MDKRPYQYINKTEREKMGLRHAIMGIILVAAMFFLLIFLWGIFQPAPPIINDRVPALEKLIG